MVLLTIALLALAGWPLAGAIDAEARGGRRAGEALLFGSAAAVVILELLAIAGIGWSRATLLLPLGGLAAATATVSRKHASRPLPGPCGSRLWHALDAVTALLIAADLLYASGERPYEWDYFGIWGFKAHVFFNAHSVAWTTLRSPDFLWTQPGHPLFAPLLYDVVAIVGARWKDTNLGLLATAFAVALILVVRGVVAAESGSRLRRTAVTLAVTPAALSIWIGLAEPFLIAFATAGVLVVRRGIRSSSSRSIAAGAALLGCAIMTKDEGLAFLFATIVAVLVDARWRSLLNLWPALAVPIPWFVIRQRAGVSTGLFAGEVASRIQRLEHPAAIFRTMFDTIVTNHVFWWAAVVTIVFFWREIWTSERFLLVVIAVQFSAYVGQNFLVPWDPLPHIVFSWSRLLDQFAAIVAFAAAMVLTSAVENSVATTRAPHAYQ